MDRKHYEQLGVDQMTVESKLELMKLISQDLYDNSRRAFRPMYPWVFVQVLPKEQMYHGLIHTVSDQNKPVHEGIVLATWAPFEKHTGQRLLTTGATVEKYIMIKSEFDPGDHVLFPHWAGRDITGFSEEKYRVVREEHDANEGGIFARVEYDESFATEHNQLYGTLVDMLSSRDGVSNDEQAAALAATQIENQFTLLSKLHRSVTFSGK